MNQDRVHKAKKRRLRPLFISLFIEYLEYAMAKLIKYFLLSFSWSRNWSNTLLFIFLTSKLSQNLSNLWIWANTPFSKVFEYLCRRFSGPWLQVKGSYRGQMQDGDHTDGHYITLFAEQLTRTFEVLVLYIFSFFELCLQLTPSNALMNSENCVRSTVSSSPPMLSMMAWTLVLVSRSGFTSLRAPSASLMRIWPHLRTSSFSNNSWPWDESSHYSLFWLSALYFKLFWVKLS